MCSSPGIGVVRTGGDWRCCLRSSRATTASCDHSNLSCFFSNLEKGRPLSPSFERNLFRAAMHPVSFWTSLIEDGVSMFMMALIFSKFASIPLWLIMKPSSFPDGTPKKHLVRFNFHLKLRKMLKVSSRSGIKELYSFVFTTTSST